MVQIIGQLKDWLAFFLRSVRREYAPSVTESTNDPLDRFRRHPDRSQHHTDQANRIENFREALKQIFGSNTAYHITVGIDDCNTM